MSDDKTCVLPEACLVGNIDAAVDTLISKYAFAFHEAKRAFRVRDLQVLMALVILPRVIFRFINNQIINKTIRRKNPLDFDDTPYLSPVCKQARQLGLLGFGVYIGELFMIFLGGLGVPHLQDKPRMLVSLVFSWYIAKTLSNFVTHFTSQACLHQRGEESVAVCSQVALLNRLLDSVIYLVMALLFLDANNIDMGMALNYLLTLGSVSSVVVGLALRDPLTEIVQGTNLLLSNKFSPGETIRMADGTCGKVQQIEWTAVAMYGDDNSIVRIPHSKLAMTPIVNMSRMDCSQVSQTLKLPTKCPERIQALMDDIKAGIREACPKLIDDGSQPFRVNWTGIEGEKIVISIESHYEIPRLGDEYWENRQTILGAINLAVTNYKDGS